MSRLYPILILLLLAGPAAATIPDDEPGNNDPATMPAILVGGVDGARSDSGILELGEIEPGEGEEMLGDHDIFRINDLAEGEVLSVSTAPLDDAYFETPETILAIAVAPDRKTGPGESPPIIELIDMIVPPVMSTFPIANEDPGEGEKFRGSGSLIRFLVPADGDYLVVVSGAGDLGFDRDHVETGRYLLVVSISSSLATSADDDDEPANDSIDTATQWIDVTESPRPLGAMEVSGILALELDDDDWGRVDGVREGEVLTAFTSPLREELPGDDLDFYLPNTLIGIYSRNGEDPEELLATNDDSENDDYLFGFGSLVRFRAPADGTYYVKVSPSPSIDVEGFPEEAEGRYLLSVAVPEPTGGALHAAALGVLLVLAARRRAA